VDDENKMLNSIFKTRGELASIRDTNHTAIHTIYTHIIYIYTYSQWKTQLYFHHIRAQTLLLPLRVHNIMYDVALRSISRNSLEAWSPGNTRVVLLSVFSL